MNWMDTQTHVNPMAMASKGSVWNVSVVKLTSPVWPQSVGQRPSIHSLIASELHNCIIGVRQHCQILFIWFVETGFDYWSTFSTKTTNKNENERKWKEKEKIFSEKRRKKLDWTHFCWTALRLSDRTVIISSSSGLFFYWSLVLLVVNNRALIETSGDKAEISSRDFHFRFYTSSIRGTPCHDRFHLFANG